jgi:hypothetical protein
MTYKVHFKNIIVVGVLLISSIAIHLLQKEAPSTDIDEVAAEQNIDTMIPKNHSLIPIEIKNSESLDSIFGNYGHVNLYIEKGQQQVLIAKHVRLLRAPKNPSHFAVLVKDSEANYITKYDQAFYVSLSSHKNIGTVFVLEKKALQHIQVGLEHE